MNVLDSIERFVLGVRATQELRKPCDASQCGADYDFLWFLVDKLSNGELEEIVRDSRVRELLTLSAPSDGFDEVKERCLAYVKTGERVRNVVLLLLGVSALKLFIQANWTGPATESDDQLFANVKDPDEMNKVSVKALDVEGESAYHLINNPALLVLANFLLREMRSVNSSLTSAWWGYRCAFVHQLILLDRCQELYKTIKDDLLSIETSTLTQDDDQQGTLKMQFFLEAAIAHLFYFDVSTSQSYLDKAKELSGAEFKLTGALGTRTYFQQTPLPQLVLGVSKSADIDSLSATASCPVSDLPRKVLLKDDTVMNEVKFSEEQPEECQLTPEEQCLILATCLLRKNLCAPEPLRDEETMAYIERVIAEPKAWSVHFSALFQRSRVESANGRRVERAMSQLQCLVDSVKSKQPRAILRQELFFCAGLPPLWNVEKELGHLFFSLGAAKSALDVFLRYELWEDVVQCYVQIQRRDRAEDVVRKCLEKEETPLLYCLLGDVTDDPKHYLKAWELSDKKSSRAQRSLGMYHYRKREYGEAIPYLERSLELNGLQAATWFSLGYAALQAENLELSVKSYKRVVALDPDNYEAWNNMANAYIRMGDKQKAWKVLRESLKCNYEDWRIWENYLLVSVDVGAFEECIKAWHRVIDIRGKHADAKVASILVKAVLEGIVGMTGQSAAGIKPKLLELFGRVTAGITNDAAMWHSYALLYNAADENDRKEEDVEKMLQFYQKSYRCLTQKQHWMRDVDLCCAILEKSRELLEAYVTASGAITDAGRRKQLLSSVKITVHGTAAAVSGYKVNYSSEQLKRIEPLVEVVRVKLSELEGLLC